MNQFAVQHERGPRIGTKEYEKMMFPMSARMSPDMFLPPMMTHDMMMAHMSSLPPYYMSMPDFFPYGMYQQEIPMPIYPPTPPKFEMTHMQTQIQVSEQTAQILFAIVEYIREQCIGIVLQDQKVLLRSSWRELFFIKAAETNLVNQLPLILETLERKWHEQRSVQNEMVLQEANLCDLILKQMDDYKVSLIELNCLRAVILFRPVTNSQMPCVMNGVIETKDLVKGKLIAKRFKTAEKEFRKIVSQERIDSLANCIRNIEQVSPFTIEEMFFRPAIGPNTLVTAITNILDPAGAQPTPMYY